MRLTEEVKKYGVKFRKECDDLIKSDVGGVIKEQIPMVDAVLEMLNTIEAQQQEINNLNDNANILSRSCHLWRRNHERQQKTIQQLQAQVEKAGEAIAESISYIEGAECRDDLNGACEMLQQVISCLKEEAQ